MSFWGNQWWTIKIILDKYGHSLFLICGFLALPAVYHILYQIYLNFIILECFLPSDVMQLETWNVSFLSVFKQYTCLQFFLHFLDYHQISTGNSNQYINTSFSKKRKETSSYGSALISSMTHVEEHYTKMWEKLFFLI